MASRVRWVEVGASNSYTYSNGLVYSAIDARGLAVTNMHDALGRVVSKRFPDGTYISNVYDRLDLVRQVDCLGYSQSFGYDSARRLISETNALGVVTRYGYRSDGSLLATTNGLQEVTWFNYDLHGKNKESHLADGSSTTNYYDGLGRLLRSSDSNGSSVTNAYNLQGLLIASSNSVGRIVANYYDVFDRITNSVNADGVWSAVSYDLAGRMTTRWAPDGGTECFGFTLNVAGVTSITNQLGQCVALNAYDALGRLTNVVNPGLSTNRYTYSAAGDLREFVDGKSQSTFWGVDLYGRTVSKTNATGIEVFRALFDASGRITNRWSAAKGATTYSYDAEGRLLTVNYPTSPDLTFAYDSLGRATNVVDASGTTRATYGAGGLLASVDGPWAADIVS